LLPLFTLQMRLQLIFGIADELSGILNLKIGSEMTEIRTKRLQTGRKS
jgi:hypothetical protein